MRTCFAGLRGWVIACALALAACSPMTPDVVSTPPPPTATPTNTPQATATPVPSPTSLPAATPVPSATPAPTATRPPATSVPTAIPTPVGSSPVSKYFVPLAGQISGPAAVLTLQRLEFWQELTRTKPRNGLFIVFVGELKSATAQVACAHADNLALMSGSRRYETTSTDMDPFKALYKTNYPGSVLGQCVVRPEPTFFVFDTTQTPGPTRLTFNNVSFDLGDLTALVRKSGFPLPGSETQLKTAVEKLLAPSPRITNRLLDFKLADAPALAGAKLATVAWVIEDTGDAVKTRTTLKSEATALFRGVYTAPGVTIAGVEVSATLRAFDVFGNPKDALIARLSLDAATAAKINWTNFQAENLFAVAKVIALDPILKE
ncbi:MAG: hypothetical protein HZB53_21635 [Chloroflexi bacterium]|nr:hypothetical protein [Chloroflexota bacterium]